LLSYYPSGNKEPLLDVKHHNPFCEKMAFFECSSGPCEKSPRSSDGSGGILSIQGSDKSDSEKIVGKRPAMFYIITHQKLPPPSKEF
jgi:hypothetical protein